MNIYHQQILEHAKNPRNRKKLKNPTASSNNANPSCGDRVSIDILIENGLIKDIGFNGKGCAISQATASILTDYVKNQPVSVIKEFTPEDLWNILGIELSPTRKKCALVSYNTLMDALKPIDE